MSKEFPVAITGMGAVSAIGMNVPAHFDALRHSRSGITSDRRPGVIYPHDLPAGEIAAGDSVFYQQLGIPEREAWTRSTLLAAIAMEEAVQDAGMQDARHWKTGLISATTVGGMDVTERYYHDYLQSEKHRHFIAAHPCGYGTMQLAKRYNIKDYVTTISTACSSAANAIMLGARMIRAGLLDRVVAGGTDCLSSFTMNGFRSLMIYSDKHCRPFDADRSGLNLGEAAAYIVLESERSVSASRRVPLAYLRGYGNANDAYHQTASSDSGEGAYRAMHQALETAGLKPQQVDYINAHGTATANNDQSESIAFLRLYDHKDKMPPFSSTKAYTGHTLAAAGAIEAVFSILSIQNQCIFPNLHFCTPIPGTGLLPVTEWKTGRIGNVLSNSFGFGGNCTSLIFSKG